MDTNEVQGSLDLSSDTPCMYKRWEGDCSLGLQKHKDKGELMTKKGTRRQHPQMLFFVLRKDIGVHMYVSDFPYWLQ